MVNLVWSVCRSVVSCVVTEKDVHSGGTAASGSAAAGWAGWAVSGMTSLTSKIYKGKGTPGQQAQTGAEKAQTPGTGREVFMSFKVKLYS